MKKIIILCATLLIGASIITAADQEKPMRIGNIHPIIKGFGFGLGTGLAAALVDMKISDRHYEKRLHQRPRVMIPGCSFLIEPIGRRIAIKKWNMTPDDKNMFGWAAWGGSWCALFVSAHLYGKYRNR